MPNILLNFRGTAAGPAGFPGDGVGETAPNRYGIYPTVLGGVTLGWSNYPGAADVDGTVDRRLAGFQSASASGDYFRIALPSAGTYTLNVAFGYAGGGVPVQWELRDGATTVLKAWNHTAIPANTWYDAADVSRAAATWPASNTAATVTTTGTDLRLYATAAGSAVAYLGLSPAVTSATTYTLTAPATNSGVTGTASGNFTVTPNGNYTGTVTPSDGGSGGIFSPASLAWSGTSLSKTFTYAPASTGAKTVSTTSSPALTNPASVAYTSLPTPVTAGGFNRIGMQGGFHS